MRMRSSSKVGAGLRLGFKAWFLVFSLVWVVDVSGGKVSLSMQPELLAGSEDEDEEQQQGEQHTAFVVFCTVKPVDVVCSGIKSSGSSKVGAGVRR
jgi:hypothetical protein